MNNFFTTRLLLIAIASVANAAETIEGDCDRDVASTEAASLMNEAILDQIEAEVEDDAVLGVSLVQSNAAVMRRKVALALDDAVAPHPLQPPGSTAKVESKVSSKANLMMMTNRRTKGHAGKEQELAVDSSRPEGAKATPEDGPVSLFQVGQLAESSSKPVHNASDAAEDQKKEQAERSFTLVLPPAREYQQPVHHEDALAKFHHKHHEVNHSLYQVYQEVPKTPAAVQEPSMPLRRPHDAEHKVDSSAAVVVGPSAFNSTAVTLKPTTFPLRVLSYHWYWQSCSYLRCSSFSASCTRGRTHLKACSAPKRTKALRHFH